MSEKPATPETVSKINTTDGPRVGSTVVLGDNPERQLRALMRTCDKQSLWFTGRLGLWTIERETVGGVARFSASAPLIGPVQ